MDKNNRVDRLRGYSNLIVSQKGKAVRPFRTDGFMNLITRYGTAKDDTEQYVFVSEPPVADEVLSQFYEENGLFAKVIDAPAEEAVRKGFELDGIKDDAITSFMEEALDELDWEENAMNCIKWARLFGGSIAVMLINDGRGLEEPLDWNNIKSIDDIRVYDRSMLVPDYNSLFYYDPQDPFRTRSSRLGTPEYYEVISRYGNFKVHDSRCLVFRNGVLPERSTNMIYQLWGVPEYVRLNKAIRDAEVAHRSGPKMLSKSVQPIYKMAGLSSELATVEGENRVLKRLQTIDTARGMMNTITVDSEGEDYEFKTFAFTGVSDVIDSSCNFLSALSNIPQTILFGRSPAGMNATGESDFENYYNYVERIQKRMLKGNLRYLLSIIFQAGVSTGEVEAVPDIKVKFNPLWSMSQAEEIQMDLQKAQVESTKAQTAQAYVGMGVIDPSEVRIALHDSEDFDVEELLDDYTEEELAENAPQPQGGGAMGGMEGMGGMMPLGMTNASGEAQGASDGVPNDSGSSPAAPAATKLPQDMTEEEVGEFSEGEEEQHSDSENGEDEKKLRYGGNKVPESNEDSVFFSRELDDELDDWDEEFDPVGSVGVLVVKDGKILTAERLNGGGYGLICGPGGHIDEGEFPEDAAIRETQEEFGITPKNLIFMAFGKEEAGSGLTPAIFLCTDFEGEPKCEDMEMIRPKFRSLYELKDLGKKAMFKPFADSISMLYDSMRGEDYSDDVEKFNKNYRKVLTNELENGIIRMQTREDGKKSSHESQKPERWITVEGQHIGLDKNGIAVAGWSGFRGRDFSASVSDVSGEEVKTEKTESSSEQKGETKSRQELANERRARKEAERKEQEEAAKRDAEEQEKKRIKKFRKDIRDGQKEIEKKYGVSSRGKNKKCLGFKDKLTPDGITVEQDHFERHGMKEMGLKTPEEYKSRFDEVLAMPCGGDWDGYVDKTGRVVRYNKKTTEYATGYPGRNYGTFMLAEFGTKGEKGINVNNAMNYYLRHRRIDLGLPDIGLDVYEDPELDNYWEE